MRNLYSIPHWIGVLAIAAFVVIFLSHPHLVGIGENPDIKTMTSDVLISGRYFKDQKSKDLHSKYGCKFWKYQEQALDKNIKYEEISISTYAEIREDELKFMKNYPEKRSKLESKLETEKKPNETVSDTMRRYTEISALDNRLKKSEAKLELFSKLIQEEKISINKLLADKEIVIGMISQCTTQPNSR
jgi:hypothetical protein